MRLWPEQRGELPVRRRAHQLAGVGSGELPEQLAGLDLDRRLLEELLRDPSDVLAEPGSGREVDRVGRLMKSDPAQEQVAVDVEARARRREVGTDEQQP